LKQLIIVQPIILLYLMKFVDNIFFFFKNDYIKTIRITYHIDSFLCLDYWCDNTSICLFYWIWK